VLSLFFNYLITYLLGVPAATRVGLRMQLANNTGITPVRFTDDYCQSIFDPIHSEYDNYVPMNFSKEKVHDLELEITEVMVPDAAPDEELEEGSESEYSTANSEESNDVEDPYVYYDQPKNRANIHVAAANNSSSNSNNNSSSVSIRKSPRFASKENPVNLVPLFKLHDRVLVECTIGKSTTKPYAGEVEEIRDGEYKILFDDRNLIHCAQYCNPREHYMYLESVGRKRTC
jgi:hypothetical protein